MVINQPPICNYKTKYGISVKQFEFTFVLLVFNFASKLCFGYSNVILTSFNKTSAYADVI